MALPLYVPACIRSPQGPYHFPSPEKPLRIQIEGPLIAIKRLLPHIDWQLDRFDPPFPRPGGPELAKLTFQKIFGRDVCPEIPNDLVVRDEYLGWVQGVRPIVFLEIDYYGVTFDHLVPADDTDPEVLQINIIEIEDDNGVYANRYMDFAVDPVEFVGKRVLAVPRCCGKRKGTQDRGRVNDGVLYRLERERKEMMTGSTECCSGKALGALQSN